MTDHDQTIIDGVLSVMGEVGLATDHKRLREAIEQGAGSDKLAAAVEIAVAFMRYAEELKRGVKSE